MQEKTLTVAIATYNRRDYLKENLDVLLPQCYKHKEIISVVVSDNASLDDTKDLINDYISKYPGLILYNRNKENLGLQGNFSKAVELSESRYIYLMGDDDILSPNFIDIILPYLTGNDEYGIIHWGRLVGDENCTNNHIHDPYFDSVIKIYPVGDFVKRTLSSTNFLSSCLFNKKCWQTGADCEDKTMPGYGYYARFLWGAIELDLPCVYYYFPLVIMRNPRRTWAKDGSVYFFCEMYEIFRHIDKVIPGTYKMWENRANDNYFYDRNTALLQMYNDPSYYRPYYNKIIKALSSKEKILFHFVMLKPKSVFLERIYHIFFSVIVRMFR